MAFGSKVFSDPFSRRFVAAPTRGLAGTQTMVGTKFIPNPGFDMEMRLDPVFQTAMRARADLVARVAEENVARAKDEMRKPGKTPSGKLGFMPRSGERLMVVEEAPNGDLLVINTDHGGHLYEWGSVRTAPYAPMRNAVRAVGLESGNVETLVSGGL